MIKSVLLKSLLGGFVLMIALSCSRGISSSASAKPATSVVSSHMDNDILGYINQHRRSIGRAPLEMLGAASEQAYIHSKEMALHKTGFGHDGFDTRVAHIIISAGRMSAWAENVAYGNQSAEEVVKGWLNSPPHKKNIEGNYTLTGIGVYKDRDGTIFFTQIFLKK
jgi:uncharacterized protein YkwD